MNLMISIMPAVLSVVAAIRGRRDPLPSDERERGRVYAETFLASNPSETDLDRVWGLIREGLGIDPRPAWARGAWDVLDRHMKGRS